MKPRRATSIARYLFAGFLGFLCNAGAEAAEIYQCLTNGVKTFVDSPNRCPNVDVQRQRGDESKPGGVVPHSATASRDVAPIKNVRPVAGTPATPGRPVPACQELAQDAARFRQCLREKRRAEVRQIASQRLEAMSRSIADYVSLAARTYSVLATSKAGRPPVWCEGILEDVIALKNLEVVDNEDVGGPRWTQAGSGTAHTSAEILDPDFKEWSVGESKVPDGYVTVRWRGSLVVLRVAAACADGGSGRASCIPQRYTSIYVYDDLTPVACHISAVGRPYWPNWKDSMTPIFAAGVPRMGR